MPASPSYRDPPAGGEAEELLTRAARGDREGFRLLVEMHQPYAYALAFRLLRDPERARDAVQESFVRVWKHLASYHAGGRFTTWLYRIVVNLCYDAMRRERVRRGFFGNADPASAADDPPDPAGLQQQVEAQDLAANALRIAHGLPPKQRLVFMLRDVQDMEIGEIAESTGMSEGTVKANLSHARKKIRESLEKLERQHGHA